jgi:hypothetical protein
MVKKHDKKPKKHPVHPINQKKKKVHHQKQKQKQNVNIKLNIAGGGSGGGGSGGIMHSERVIERLPQSVGTGGFSLDDVSNFIRSIQIPVKQAEKLPEKIAGPTSNPVITTVGSEVRDFIPSKKTLRTNDFTTPYKLSDGFPSKTIYSENVDKKRTEAINEQRGIKSGMKEPAITSIKRTNRPGGGRRIGSYGIKRRTEIENLALLKPIQPIPYISATPIQRINANDYITDSTVQTIKPRPLKAIARQKIPNITDSDISLIPKKKK